MQRTPPPAPLPELLIEELNAQGNHWDQDPKLYFVFPDRIEELRMPESMHKLAWGQGLHPRRALKNLVDAFTHPATQAEYRGNSHGMTGMALYFEAYSIQRQRGEPRPVGNFSEMEEAVEQRCLVAHVTGSKDVLVKQDRGGYPVHESNGTVVPGTAMPAILAELARLARAMTAPPATFRN